MVPVCSDSYREKCKSFVVSVLCDKFVPPDVNWQPLISFDNRPVCPLWGVIERMSELNASLYPFSGYSIIFTLKQVHVEWFCIFLEVYTEIQDMTSLQIFSSLLDWVLGINRVTWRWIWWTRSLGTTVMPVLATLTKNLHTAGAQRSLPWRWNEFLVCHFQEFSLNGFPYTSQKCH